MKIFKLLTVAVILILCCGTALADISVYFSPADSTHPAGSSFTIGILADIPQDPGLVAYGFNLLWDDSKMQLKDVNGIGSPFDILWDVGTPMEITGLLFPTPTSPASEFGDAILLANLDFKCLQEGFSGLSIDTDPGLVALGLQGFYGPDPTAPPIDFTVTDGSVTQSPSVAPEPSTILLIPAGLAGLAFWRKRK